MPVNFDGRSTTKTTSKQDGPKASVKTPAIAKETYVKTISASEVDTFASSQPIHQTPNATTRFANPLSLPWMPGPRKPTFAHPTPSN